MNYIEKLDELFKYYLSECKGNESKMQFLGDVIFDFTTYDSAMDEILASKMVAVIGAILSKTTYEYIKVSEESYLDYITMVNMPFLQDKLEWGTSIRGAWFDKYPKGGSYQITPEFSIPGKEVEDLMGAVIEWSSSTQNNNIMEGKKEVVPFAIFGTKEGLHFSDGSIQKWREPESYDPNPDVAPDNQNTLIIEFPSGVQKIDNCSRKRQPY